MFEWYLVWRETLSIYVIQKWKTHAFQSALISKSLEVTGFTELKFMSDATVAWYKIIWAHHEKTCHQGLWPDKTNWPAQLQKLATVLKFWIKQVKVLYYLGSEQQRCWSDCTDAQADLRLRCLHLAKTGFLMMWLKWYKIIYDWELKNEK